jgi:hypothetical protein
MSPSRIFVWLFVPFLQWFFCAGIARSASNVRLTQGTVDVSCSPDAPSPAVSGDRRKNAKIPFKDVCFDQKIVPSSDVTYFQAMKEIFPDLQDNGSGHATQVRERRSEISADKLWLGESNRYEFERTNNYLLIEEKNQTQLVLLYEDKGFLALYSIKPKFKLLDFIDVQRDQHSSLMVLPPYDVFPVRPGVWLFPVSNWHDNSSQSYDNNLLFLILDQKLHLVYEGPDLLGTRDSKRSDCAYVEGLLELKPLQTQHEQFSDISLKLNREHSCAVEDKKTGQTVRKPVHEKIYPATLYWDPVRRKYMGGSIEFVRDRKRD